MTGKRKKKGIMGGTFDPIHIGHLILGENACLQFGLDSVLFMPSGNPPHKPHRPGRATTDQRVEMVRLAIADNPHFELSLAETHDQGYTYTKETLLGRRSRSSGCHRAHRIFCEHSGGKWREGGKTGICHCKLETGPGPDENGRTPGTVASGCLHRLIFPQKMSAEFFQAGLRTCR